MKDITKFLKEALEGETKQPTVNESESIKSEKDFREWAESKFKEVFGDDYDEAKMKETVDGFLEENSDLVEEDEWGELVGMMNQSFSKDKDE